MTARYRDQYDVDDEEQRAAAERLGIEYKPSSTERTRRYRARLRGELPPLPPEAARGWRPDQPVFHLAADLAANAVRNDRGCLIWQRAKSPRGYGRLKRKGKSIYAHRASLEDKLGRPLGPGLCARHTCDVRLCIEPEHLIEGTKRQNAHDMIERGRASWQQRPG